MELREGKNYALKSRAIGILGIGDSIEEARNISQEGANAVTGGALWNRTDIAAKRHIQKSIGQYGSIEAKGLKRVFVSDCEGPISKNDNAFELAENLFQTGKTLLNHK